MLDLPGLKSKAATAFCVPLQTKRRLPEGSNARAFGCAPNRSEGLTRPHTVSIILSVRVSTTDSVSLPALATTSQRPLGDTSIAQGCSPTRIVETFSLADILRAR